MWGEAEPAASLCVDTHAQTRAHTTHTHTHTHISSVYFAGMLRVLAVASSTVLVEVFLGSLYKQLLFSIRPFFGHNMTSLWLNKLLNVGKLVQQKKCCSGSQESWLHLFM